MQRAPADVTEPGLARTPHTFVNDSLPPAQDGCLHELFEASADLAPEASALICGDERLTYQELERRSNQLARYLRLRGARPGRLVGLYFERSERPIIAILACLKAGAAYVPIDPTFPAERIRHILAEAQPVLLLTEGALAARAEEITCGAVVDVDALAAEIGSQEPRRPLREETRVSPADLCYVMYTSGTTGHPKGVMTEHRSAFKFVHAFNEVCAVTPEDRVYQGFLLGFDGSVEELWMAFSNGATLVVPGRQSPRFGDELGQLLARHGVTYFSTVPTVLATITSAVPSLRLLVVSGEPCPAELVNRWASPRLRMLNVYGPTETTVNATAAECIAGCPVTIGRPLRGYHLHLLDEAGNPVAQGQTGELYIGGETLARGYLKRPEATAERFVAVPGIAGRGGARLYRTGDLVRESATGELDYLGRKDGQIKLRGYRVELAEIESVLLEKSGVRSASVKLVENDGLQELAAFVVLATPSEPFDRAEMLARLETRLPHYMVPRFLDILGELPALASGKVDRGRLPAPVALLVRAGSPADEPMSELEAKIALVWARVLGLPRVSATDDFFVDLGGHSLLAARVVTLLRPELGIQVSIRDVYGFATVRKLAGHLASVPAPGDAGATCNEKPGVPSSRAVFDAQSPWTRRGTAALQGLSMYLLYSLAMVPFAVAVLLARGWLGGHVPLGLVIGIVIAMTLAAWPAGLLVSIAAKWLLIGRYKPGRYPLWGFYYFRWWLVGRFQGLSGAGALAGTPLLPLYFRLMGARVGRRCTLDSALCSAWDMISIGDDTSIGADTQLLGYRVENGMLVLGRVDIGSRCFVGLHSALGLSVKMADDARLDDQSLLPDGQAIPAGEAWRGSPARPGVVSVPRGAPPVTSSLRRALFGMAHLVLAELLAIPFLFQWGPPLALVALAYFRGGVALAVATMFVSAPASVLLHCLLLAAVRRLLLRRTEPGVYRIESAFYVRKWLADGLMAASRGALLPLYTTLYLPPWLRLLGAKIGPRAELSTVWRFAPEFVSVGAESFFADGSIIGGKRLHRGLFEIGINRIGRRSFVGNSAVLPMGAGLGERCLLGVQSITPEAQPATEDGTEWLGSPAFSLPNRPRVGGFDDTVTYRPTTKLYLQRAVIDALRILIPSYMGLTFFVAGALALYLSFERLGVAATFALVPLYAHALGVIAALAVVVLKKLVMGTFVPVVKPLWSMYVWLNEMVNGVYESVMAPAIAPFLGTPFVAPFLRLLGCKIGRHTYIGTTLFSEFDLVEIGDHAALNVGAVIQNHLFEDRIMKSSYLKIGDECSVGNMAVVLYDSEMKRGAWLGPLSLLMKGETLAPRGRWHGIPTVQAPDAVAVEKEDATNRPS